MRPKRSISALAFLALGTNFAAGASKQPDLPSLLAGLDRASRLYLDTALRFTCDETITQPIYRGLHTGHFRYIFVYDDHAGFKDYRMEAGRGEQPPVDPSQTGFRMLQRSYFWVLSFQAKRQRLHHYTLAGEEAWAGKRTVLVRFEPIPPYREGINDWFGTAWVDPSSFQILKVEAIRADHREVWDRILEDQRAMDAGAPLEEGKSWTILRVSTEFKSLKNGMRFPSRSRVIQLRYELSRINHEPSVVSEEDTVQTYRNYRFYGVRTSEEIRSLLSGRNERK